MTCPTSNGYPRIGQHRVHVLIAARALGRPLPRGAVVHHANGNKLDNRPANLVICQDQSYHLLLHERMTVVALGGDPNEQRRCSFCRQLRNIADMGKRHTGTRTRTTICRECCTQAARRWRQNNPERYRARYLAYNAARRAAAAQAAGV